MSTAAAKPIPSPGELLRRYGLAPRKSWGQNFLHAREIHHQIVAAAGVGPGDTAIEIGAGLGTLTGHLLATGARVEAIERDRDLCKVLRVELDQPNFVLHEADAVRFDYATIAEPVIAAGGRRPAVVGNLPYQLTGALLFALLEHDARTGPWIVMVQREVADRLCAEPGNKRYGGVTAALSRVRAISRVCLVNRGCFLPPPRVDSAVVRLDPRPAPLGEVPDAQAYLHLVRTCFQRRRKTLVNALTALAPREEVRVWIEQAGVDATLRPERLGPAEFAALARARARTVPVPDSDLESA